MGTETPQAQTRNRKWAFQTISFPLFLCGRGVLWHTKYLNVACSDLYHREGNNE
jgi:hypothetical protein